MRAVVLAAILALVTTAAAISANAAERPGTVTEFRTPRGLSETCVRLPQIPGGSYSKKDVEQEEFFCGLDVHANQVAMCAKFWSTSPGTMIYGAGELGQAAYEASKCGKKEGHEKLAKFKNTMNTSETSATYSTSSLLYYHLARFFESEVNVPVAVYRTLDRDSHYRRVSSRGHGDGMIGAAWEMMRAAEKNPRNYTPVDDLFTADREQIYGIMMRDKGERYGAEVNGTRAGGWGVGQNLAFQETPGFLALRSAQPLAEAVDEGVRTALRDPKVAADVGKMPLPQIQVVYWMREISEIVLFDLFFSQQDRVGNIDYEWKWYWVERGAIRSKSVADEAKDLPRKQGGKIEVPTELESLAPVLLQRTYINDNDAGGRVQYANFAKKTLMLEKFRHIAPVTYRKLLLLEADLRTSGPLAQYLKTSFGLPDKQFQMISANVALAAQILRRTCEQGALRFDLDPRAVLIGAPTELPLNCANP